MMHLPLLALLLAAAPAESPAPPDCSAPEELVDDDPQLTIVAEHLRQKHPITLVVIGGASTAGTAAAKPDLESYPRRLEAALRRRHPDVPITVINRGVARQTTEEMADRFARDVYPADPTLVIWETGTFDAVRSVDVDIFASALSAGLADLRDHKFDVMLINMQYSRDTASVINFEPYLDALQHEADVDDVYLFRRFEMMRYWSETGVFQLAEVPPARRAALVAQVYNCLGERLADAIDHAAR